MEILTILTESYYRDADDRDAAVTNVYDVGSSTQRRLDEFTRVNAANVTAVRALLEIFIGDVTAENGNPYRIHYSKLAARHENCDFTKVATRENRPQRLLLQRVTV